MSWVDIWKLILLTDLENTHLIYGRRARAPSFIIRSRYFFVFEVSRYISAPSPPRRVQSEMAPQRAALLRR